MLTLLFFACFAPSADDTGSADTGSADDTTDTAAAACLDEGGGFPDESADDLAAMQSECESDGGTDCDTAALLEVDAATCLAGVYGLDVGTAGYTAGLVYHYGDKTLCWSVSNLEYVDAADGSEGGSYL